MFLNRLSEMTGAAGRRKLSANPFVYAYSGSGRRVSPVTFPTGAHIGKDYDTLGRLTATYLKRQDNTDLNVTHFFDVVLFPELAS